MLRARLEPQGLRAQLVLRALLEPQGLLVRALRARRVLLVLRARLVLQVQRGPQVQPLQARQE